MVATRKKRQSNRRPLSQLDDFDQDIIFGNTARDRQENAMVNEGTGDQEFTVGISDNNLMANENTVNMKSWKDVLMKRLTGKGVLLLTRSRTGSKTPV